MIYYWTAAEDVCYMLYAYAKNEQGDLTRAQIRVLARLVREEFTRSHCFASRRATPKRWRTRCTSLRSAVRHNVRWTCQGHFGGGGCAAAFCQVPLQVNFKR